MILTPDQAQEMMDTIEYFHILFINRNVGDDVLTASDIAILKKNGMNPALIAGSKIEDAYKFGILSSALKDKRIKNMTYDEFKRFLKSGGFAPLTQAERYGLNAVKRQAYGDIRGLGNRIGQQINQIFVEHSKVQRKKVEKIIEETLNEVMLNRGSVNQLSSELGKKTKDWARDFDRISDYIMHDAYQHGIATHIQEVHGNDALVYYDVYPGACDHCIRTYLTGKIGSEPKVFKLADLLRNGSNIGVKAKDYKPSVSPLHPWCRCTLTALPANSIWDVYKQQYVITRNKYGVDRKTKIKVTITK